MTGVRRPSSMGAWYREQGAFPDPQRQVKRTVRSAAEALTSPILLSPPHTLPRRQKRETDKDILEAPSLPEGWV